MELGPPKPTRKRHRKRKRRVVSDSSSSEEDSSSSSSSSDSSTPKNTVLIPVQKSKPARSEDADEDADENDEEDETSSSSSAESQDNSDSDEGGVHTSMPSSRLGKCPEPPSQRDSPSPQPNVDLPPFVPSNAPGSEQVLKEKFRKFWLASIADGFKEDLEEIRKEPNLGPSRLALLIESLASGADVFSPSSANGGMNEMEVVLDQLPS